MRTIKIQEDSKKLFYIDPYILSLKSEWLTQDTIYFYTSYIWQFVQFAKIENPKDFGNHVLVRFGYLSLFEWEKKDISNSTRLKYYNSIKKYSDFLVEMEVIDHTVITKIKRPKIAKKLPKSMDDSQVEELMSGLLGYNSMNKFYNIRNFVLIETMIYAGLRRKEVVKLKLDDYKKEYLTIRDGKWQKDRVIPLPKRLQETLTGWIEYRSKISGDSIFCTQFWDSIEPATIGWLFWRISKWLGIEIHPHLLRHTYASFCVKKGVNIYAIQSNMGHSSIETTSIYFNMTQKENLHEIQKLN